MPPQAARLATCQRVQHLRHQRHQSHGPNWSLKTLSGLLQLKLSQLLTGTSYALPSSLMTSTLSTAKCSPIAPWKSTEKKCSYPYPLTKTCKSWRKPSPRCVSPTRTIVQFADAATSPRRCWFPVHGTPRNRVTLVLTTKAGISLACLWPILTMCSWAYRASWTRSGQFPTLKPVARVPSICKQRHHVHASTGFACKHART